MTTHPENNGNSEQNQPTYGNQQPTYGHQPAYGNQPQAPQYSAQGYGQVASPAEGQAAAATAKTLGIWAVVASVLSVFVLGIVFSIVGIVLGILSYRKAAVAHAASVTPNPGRTLSIIALTVGGVALVLSIVNIFRFIALYS